MSIRKSVPVRSQAEPKKNYRAYKTALRTDFSKKCGYCDASDTHFIGPRGYQIDHFAPHSIFPDLKVSYDNLVYSCAICNRAKSDTWIGEDSNIPNNGTEGFIDPCNSNYDDQFERRQDGSISARTPLGKYMIDNLKLFLLRHQIIWRMQELSELEKRVDALLDNDDLDFGSRKELLEEFRIIAKEYKKYRGQAIEL